jgi:hypothetical protein
MTQSSEKPNLDYDNANLVPVNYFCIHHNTQEIFLDLGVASLHQDRVQIHTATVLSPPAAKKLAMVLSHLVSQFEKTVGDIDINLGLKADNKETREAVDK